MAQDRRERSWSPGSIGRGGVAWLRQWIIILRAAVTSWLRDRAPRMGAAIAYYTVFSLAPVLILIIAVAGLAFGQRAAEGALVDQIAGLVGRESAGAVQAMLRSASGTRSGIIATVVGLGALVLAATGVFGELQAALNVIWQAQSPKSTGMRNLVKVRLRSLLLIMAIGLLLMLSLALGTALAAFSGYLARLFPALPLILGTVNFVFSLAVTTLMFALMFKILPDAGVEWPDVWIGAGASALLFGVGRHLISLYIGSSGVSSTYHVAGALVLILVWIYYSAQILLFGAELAKAYGDHRRARRAAS
jgi:membrane protein